LIGWLRVKPASPRIQLDIVPGPTTCNSRNPRNPSNLGHAVTITARWPLNQATQNCEVPDQAGEFEGRSQITTGQHCCRQLRVSTPAAHKGQQLLRSKLVQITVVTLYLQVPLILASGYCWSVMPSVVITAANIID